jgi:hypothetical protein
MTKHERAILAEADDDPVHIRIGTPDDVHRMMDIAMLAVIENGFCSVNKEKLLNPIWSALNLNHGIVGIIGEPGELIQATVLLMVGSVFYSDEPILEERAIFVRPEYRSAKGGRAARLCEFSRNTSDRLGLPLAIGVLSSHRTEAKVRMYSRIMGPPSGAYWLYNVTTGGHAQVEER